MKKLYTKNILTWTIIFILSLSFNSFATEKIDSFFSCEEVIGNSAQSTKDLFSSVQRQNVNQNTPSLSKVNFSYSNGRLKFSGTFFYDGESFSIDTSGEIYKNEKTNNSGISENLIFVDMDDIANWHFVQVRIDKENQNICIILQNTSNYELVQFILQINDEIFTTFYDLDENSISGQELENKIIELYSVARNVLNRETPNTYHYEDAISYRTTHEGNISSNSTKSSYAGWKKLVEDFKNETVVT